jgi:hypothetical protein
MLHPQGADRETFLFDSGNDAPGVPGAHGIWLDNRKRSFHRGEIIAFGPDFGQRTRNWMTSGIITRAGSPLNRPESGTKR